MGLDGRERKTGSTAERARVNVPRRLADAMKKIDEACAPLGRLLAPLDPHRRVLRVRAVKPPGSSSASTGSFRNCDPSPVFFVAEGG
jgi:hypothetical protein